jgi:acyl dehydratase
MINKQVYYDDITEGMNLPEISFGPITLEMMVKFSCARNNFHPIHYDRDIARNEGHPDVLVHGPLKLALFDRLIRDWIGEFGILKKISATYRGVDLPGNTLFISGKVLSKNIEEDSGNVNCEFIAKNQKGEITTTGSAVVSLPLKKKEV